MHLHSVRQPAFHPLAPRPTRAFLLQDYNVRSYILRRSRESFEANRGAAAQEAARMLREVRACVRGGRWMVERAPSAAVNVLES